MRKDPLLSHPLSYTPVHRLVEAHAFSAALSEWYDEPVVCPEQCFFECLEKPDEELPGPAQGARWCDSSLSWSTPKPN